MRGLRNLCRRMPNRCYRSSISCFILEKVGECPLLFLCRFILKNSKISVILHRLLEKYSQLLTVLFMLGAMLLFCAGISFIIVLPLWKWATVSPKTYTIVVIALALCCVLFLLVKFFMKKGVFGTICFLLKLILVLFSLCASVFFILRQTPLYIVPILILCFLLYGLIDLRQRK